MVGTGFADLSTAEKQNKIQNMLIYENIIDVLHAYAYFRLSSNPILSNTL